YDLYGSCDTPVVWYCNQGPIYGPPEPTPPARRRARGRFTPPRPAIQRLDPGKQRPNPRNRDTPPDARPGSQSPAGTWPTPETGADHTGSTRIRDPSPCARAPTPHLIRH